ncbi:hypothetical protein JXR93_13315 [bacterium]|nr:hypothetical protein [bacterium]
MKIIPEIDEKKGFYPTLKEYKKLFLTTLSVGVGLTSASILTGCTNNKALNGEVAPVYQNSEKTTQENQENKTNSNKNSNENSKEIEKGEIRGKIKTDVKVIRGENCDNSEKSEKVEVPQKENIDKTEILMGDIAPIYPEDKE